MFAAINLGEIFWSLLVIYLMVMYFGFVFAIIRDIYRSEDLSGASKALWAVALLLFPIFTMVAYLTTRGDGMTRRQRERVEQAMDESDAYFRQVAAGGGPASEMEKAKALVDSGSISAGEYDQLKLKILA